MIPDSKVKAMKSSVKVAFCGVLAALSTVVMFLTGVIPTATIALPALAGCFLIPVVAELGKRWGLGVYLVCAALSFLLAPDREAALIYVLFFGYYPVLLPVLGRIRSKALCWAAKLAVFNAAVVLETALSIYVLGIPWESIGFLGKATAPALLVLANVMLLLYDRALNGLIVLYLRRFHDQVRRVLQMK